MRYRHVICLLSAALLLAGSCSRQESGARQPGIIPLPAFVQFGEGVFTLDAKVPVYVDSADESLLRTVAFLNERLQAAAGFSLSVIADDPLSHGDERAVFILEAGLPTEAYNLEITPRRVLIEYGDGAGVFYALQTLFQLLPDAIFADSSFGSSSSVCHSALRTSFRNSSIVVISFRLLCLHDATYFPE